MGATPRPCPCSTLTGPSPHHRRTVLGQCAPLQGARTLWAPASSLPPPAQPLRFCGPRLVLDTRSQASQTHTEEFGPWIRSRGRRGLRVCKGWEWGGVRRCAWVGRSPLQGLRPDTSLSPPQPLRALLLLPGRHAPQLLHLHLRQVSASWLAREEAGEKCGSPHASSGTSARSPCSDITLLS